MSSSSSSYSSSCTKWVKPCSYMVWRCCCAKFTIVKTLTTNLGQRFYGHDNFPNKECRYFDWLDKNFSEKAKDHINGYHTKNGQLRRQIQAMRGEPYEGNEVMKMIEELKYL